MLSFFMLMLYKGSVHLRYEDIINMIQIERLIDTIVGSQQRLLF